jgi:tetratricopeptide (TPR) repeat protein/serine/threonine protein kinase
MSEPLKPGIPTEALRLTPGAAQASGAEGPGQQDTQCTPRKETDGAPAAGAEATLPERLGSYRVTSELGRGGMGVVYRVLETGLNRSLAIKVLLEEHKDNPALCQRFVEEAQIMGQLQHPGVVPIHELGQLEDGRPFFTLRQIKGTTLAELLKSQESATGSRQSDPEAVAKGQESAAASMMSGLPGLLNIFAQVCQTMAFAHSRGIIHRDLKPANVMVGAFGEIQVMDWGLAKVLGAASEERLSPAAKDWPASTILTVRTALPDSGQTEAGTVLGTPAYMAPEQARGEVELLDERADVFGLGAILCEVLTGQPPFTGASKLVSHRKAMKGDVVEALARLDGCGADTELVALARACLAPEREQRPVHAGAVADAVAAYQAGVQERLRRAELERAQAQVQAVEEAKRVQVERQKVQVERQKRRVTLTLALVGLALLLTLAGAALWLVRDAEASSQRRQQLESDLDKQLDEIQQQRQNLHGQLADGQQATQLLSDIDGWTAQVKRLRQIWNQADLLRQRGADVLKKDWSARLAEQDNLIQADEEDWHAAKRLDDIRLEASTVVEGKYVGAKAVKKYAAVFAGLGLDVVHGDPAKVAALVGQQRIRAGLLAALDHWVSWLGAEDKKLQLRLLEIARRADPDPWADQLRNPATWKNKDRLLALSHQAPAQASPTLILVLATRIRTYDVATAAALVRQALLRYPRDFWLHFALGSWAEDVSERVGCCQAAVALRPDYVHAYFSLGNALHDKNDLEGAVTCQKKAIALDPDFYWGHYGLGRALHAKNDLERAMRCFKTTLRFDPNYAQAHIALGLCLAAKNDLEGAIECYYKGIKLDPNDPLAHMDLGNALLAKKDLEGALPCFKRATEIDPKNVLVWNALGNCLTLQNALPAAIDAYKKALAIDPKNPSAWTTLGLTQQMQGDLSAAIKAFNIARAIDPKFAYAWSAPGDVLYSQNDLPGAFDAFKKALAIDPKSAHAWFGLGNVHFSRRELATAIDAYKKALAFNPKLAMAWNNIGGCLVFQNDLPGAVDALKKALAIDPKLTFALTGLGAIQLLQHDLPGAIKSYKAAIKINPNDAQVQWPLGNALAQQGDFAGAVAVLQRALQLFPKGAVLRPTQKLEGLVLRPTVEQKLKLCQQVLTLEPRLPNALKGEKCSPTEYLALAELCWRSKKRYRAAVDFYAKAFAEDPKLAEDLQNGARTSAACAAALAAAGKGMDGAKLSEEEKPRLRQQALDWLKAHLATLREAVKQNPALAVGLPLAMQHLRTDPNLAGVREAKELARLPAAQQTAWKNFWADVAALSKQPGSKPHGPAKE